MSSTYVPHGNAQTPAEYQVLKVKTPTDTLDFIPAAFLVPHV